MWQKSSLLQAHGGPLTGIESGRISANGAHFKTVFHANPIGAICGGFREVAGSGKREFGADSGLFSRGGSYLPVPGSAKVVSDHLI
jgi:hypothetical protein